MKKKVLFVMNNLSCGGAEKALISLLQTIDYNLYDVDLYLLKHTGLFLDKIPKQVNLLEEPDEYKYYDMSIKNAVMECLKLGKFDIALYRIIAGAIIKIEKNKTRCEQRIWKYLSRSLDGIGTMYDIAVGFLEKNPIYFCVDKVNASKKIGFIHSDYDKLGMDHILDQPYFAKLDRVVTVSDECGNILRSRFPMHSHKINVMHNIISPMAIHKLSREKVTMDSAEIKLVSVGRLNYYKGFEMAIDSCLILIQWGYSVKWYVIGEGEERGNLEKLIHEKGLNGIFILMGMKENPYPYIKEADIYVQPSRFEGKSIAIDEAKILQKPIVVTNFNTVYDQIKNTENGIIVDMTAESISEGIKTLIENEDLRNYLKINLANEQLGTESEIHKLYEIFN